MNIDKSLTNNKDTDKGYKNKITFKCKMNFKAN